jgi:3-keto-5-aminohexanoate cleavage enzyme
MVAPNGARRTKADHPALPISPAELAREAAACLEAGAALFHLHVRDPNGRHSLDAATYRAAMDAIHAAVGQRLILQVTTESAGIFRPQEQMAVVRQLKPEAISVAVRELIPDSASEAGAGQFFAWLFRERITPHYLLYTPEDVLRFAGLRRRGVIPGDRAFVQFVLGRYDSGRAADPLELLRFLAQWAFDGPWSVCAFGKRESACTMLGATLGGHIRIGFENNLWMADGSLAPTNAALVAQAARGAAAIGRPVADADTAREMLS